MTTKVASPQTEALSRAQYVASRPLATRLREMTEFAKKLEEQNIAQLNALKLLWAWVDDLAKSNPGYLGKLCLQDYGRMNQAFLKTERVLAQAST